MSEYLAVVKFPTQNVVKAKFGADNDLAAYDKMLKVFGCKSTNEIEEFDLLEILTDNRLRIAATKAKESAAQVPLALPAPEPPHVYDEEAVPFLQYQFA